MKPGKFPKGWDAKRVQKVIAHYDHQTDAEALAEYRAAIKRTTIEVPVSLVPAVRRLLAKQSPAALISHSKRRTKTSHAA